MRNLLFIAIFVLAISELGAQTPIKFFKDVSSAQIDDPTLVNHSLLYHDGFAYFMAHEATTGKELWRTDGTPEGTHLVKDINPGTGSSDVYSLTAVGHLIFFTTASWDLWVTDGTSNGTEKLTSNVRHPVAFGDNLIFYANTPSTGFELWKSDGTVAGTVMIKDINAGTGGSTPTESFVKVGDFLYFNAFEKTTGIELYRTDGSTAGTKLIKNISTLDNSSIPQNLTNVEGTVFFTTASENGALYKSDGSVVGTIKISVPYGSAQNITAVGNYLYFLLSDYTKPQHDYEIWRIEKNATTPELVTKVYPSSPTAYAPNHFFAYNNLLIFAGWDDAHGYELWKCDGTSAGTMLIKDITPGVTSAFQYHTRPMFTISNGILYFVTENKGQWISKTDGTAAGTSTFLNPGKLDGDIYTFAPSDDKLFFLASDHLVADALFITDGTSEGTSMVKDLLIKYASSRFQAGLNYKHDYYFVITDGEHGEELWKTDGTPEGTVMVKDIYTGPASSGPYGLTLFKDLIYFFAKDEDYGIELWRTDGTNIGTVRVSDTGRDDSKFLYNLTVSDSKLLFTSGVENQNTHVLWFSDGTPEGTDSFIPPANTRFERFSSNGNEVIMATSVGSSSGGLWRTNGTPEGTQLLKPIPAANFIRMNGILYFTSDFGSKGQLWRSDGTEDGTYPLTDACDAACNNLFTNFREIDGYLYFTGLNDVDGRTVYRSDGTKAGTSFIFDPSTEYFSGPFGYTKVKDKIFYLNINGVGKKDLWTMDENATPESNKKLYSGYGYSSLTLFSFKDQFYFTEQKNDQANVELWKSDGTSEGTIPVGLATIGSQKVMTINNAIYWVGYDRASNILQFWKTDGTCTKKLSDLPGTYVNFFEVGNKIILVIQNDEYGQALYYYDLSNEPDICKKNQVLSFTVASPQPFGKEITLNAAADTGLPITFSSSDLSIAKIEGDILIPTGIGTVTITATQAGNDNYEPQQENRTLEVIKGHQEITFNEISNPVSQRSQTIELNAYSSSGLPVSFVISDEAIGTIEDNVITLRQPGTTTVTAVQGGDDHYLPATSVTQTLIIAEITSVERDVRRAKLFPNPTSSILSLNYHVPIVNIKITDIVGQEMPDVSWNNKQVDLGLIHSGVYFVELQTSQGTETFRIIKK